MSNEQMRAEFEGWFSTAHEYKSSRLFSRVVDDRRYESMEVEYAWLAYVQGRTTSGAASGEVVDRRRCKPCAATRGGTHCWKCGSETFEPHPSVGDDPRLPPIDRIRELAKEVGYAIGVHGSQQRDLDVIAAPWTDAAIGNHALLEHIAKGLTRDNGPAHIISTERKPLGRYAATIQMDGWYKQLDISVCPNEIYERVPAPAEQSAPPVPRMGGITKDCRDDSRCQYAIDHGAEGLGACPTGKCCMPQSASTAPGQADTERDAARYRWLRESGEIVASSTGQRIAIPMYTPNETHKAELDAAIDRAIAALPKEKPADSIYCHKCGHDWIEHDPGKPEPNCPPGGGHAR